MCSVGNTPCHIILLFLRSYLLTCGSDGDVRIYKDFDDSDPESVRAGDNVTVLAVKVKTTVKPLYYQSMKINMFYQ